MIEPYYWPEERERPILSTATNPELRQVLNKGTSQTVIAIEAVNAQLKLWKDTVEKQAANTITCRLSGVDIAKLAFRGYLGENVEEDAAVIKKVVESPENANELSELKKGIWSWSKLPYAVRRVGSSLIDNSDDESEKGPHKRTKVLENDELVDDVDEWVLHNEMFLRTLSKPHADCVPALKSSSVGLVRISDLSRTLHSCALVISPNDPSYAHALKISRLPIHALPGYTILAEKRSPTIFVQPTASDFKGRFDCMSGGLLAGLDWSNIFVAGGLVLGALLTPDIPPTASVPTSERLYLNQPLEWISSDIDLYIYGLDVEAANEKIKHIAEVYQSNLGSVDAPFLVVRNSQTITLYSEWPKRRVQIVLKLVKSPREVLLNFDLDSCAVGWDGKEVWMLPRFVRALETGTNVFTMDLVNGHYLGDRKATRDKRVFKYAKRGYGIRIIPLYIGYLLSYLSSYQSTDFQQISLGENLPEPPLSLSLIAEEARMWTREVVDRYIQSGQKDLTYHWPEGRWPRVKGKNGLPVFSHAMLEDHRQNTSEPLGRSCLTGFGLLMRHVALWELEREGIIEIYEHIFAEDAYNNNGYDDTPAYEWDDKFTVEKFIEAIDSYNDREKNAMKEEWDSVADEEAEKIEFPVIKRVSYARSIEEIFSVVNDLYIPIFTTGEFVKFANDLVINALQESDLDEDKMAKVKSLPLRLIGNNNNYGVVLALWQLNNILNWQMVDRRIDEIREVLWAFHRAQNKRLYYPEPQTIIDNFKINISKRAIRSSERDESLAFVRWVGRQPCKYTTDVNGIFFVQHWVERRHEGDEDEDEDTDRDEEE
ncbi:hypothetical protein GGU10DRAFT_299913 [Lentinula aff. detonsa]|uniref:Uncharacterized protein n=1 Tax=Lentinula aff. detonsa TaxID=2804958 RepID=A0AA38L378_9AGAR|nr:hypothetical protein GGU10DRAFT_299913 [Lentinula aff. detonsa]